MNFWDEYRYGQYQCEYLLFIVIILLNWSFHHHNFNINVTQCAHRSHPTHSLKWNSYWRFSVFDNIFNWSLLKMYSDMRIFSTSAKIVTFVKMTSPLLYIIVIYVTRIDVCCMALIIIRAKPRLAIYRVWEYTTIMILITCNDLYDEWQTCNLNRILCIRCVLNLGFISDWHMS